MKTGSSESFQPGRRIRIVLSVTIAVLALGSIAVMVNMLSARHPQRFDWSGANRFELTPLTGKILASLTNSVKVTVLFTAQADLMGLTTGLLQEYERRSPFVTLHMVDHRAEPAAANALRGHYKIAADAANVVIFDCAGRTRMVYDTELSEFQADKDFLQSRQIRRAGFKGEMLFTSAIASVMDSAQTKVYFLQGHGEHKPDSDEQFFGYLKFAQLLADKNVRWETVRLHGPKDEIPADCELLIIAGPQNPPLPEEVTRLDEFLERGGRLLFLTNPIHLSRAETTGFESLFRKWGIAIVKAAAADEVYSSRGSDVQSTTFSAHPITAPLTRSEGLLLFPNPRVISVLPPEMRGAETPSGENLVMTSTNGITRSGFRDGMAFSRAGLDKRGEVPLVAAVEKGGLDGVAANRGATRVVVIGDSLMFGNEYIAAGSNRDFANLTLAWLLDRATFLAIGPKPLNEYRLNITDRQLRFLRSSLLLGMPGTVLLVGLVVWFRRRS
jgi:hypothetical protein